MKIIKFRAWNKNIDPMVYTDWNSFRNWYNQSTGGKVVYGRGFDGEKIILSEPMQYIEKEDNHKKELYEGDIVKWINNYGDENIGWIMYNKAIACFNIVLIKGSYLPFYTGSIRSFGWNELEIIGTIYENPGFFGKVEGDRSMWIKSQWKKQ